MRVALELALVIWCSALALGVDPAAHLGAGVRRPRRRADRRSSSSAAGSPTDTLDLLLDPTYPALAARCWSPRRPSTSTGGSSSSAREVRRAFSHYVSPTVVDEIIAHPERLELGGEVRELTLLFCDVRNFTSISEQLTRARADPVHQQPAHAARPRSSSSAAAPSTSTWATRSWRSGTRRSTIPTMPAMPAPRRCEMAARMDDAQRRMGGAKRSGGRPASSRHVAIGIGINSGDCCVGNLGSAQRFDYSAIGDDVNVASRLEGLSKVYGADRRHRRIDGGEDQRTASSNSTSSRSRAAPPRAASTPCRRRSAATRGGLDRLAAASRGDARRLSRPRLGAGRGAIADCRGSGHARSPSSTMSTRRGSRPGARARRRRTGTARSRRPRSRRSNRRTAQARSDRTEESPDGQVTPHSRRRRILDGAQHPPEGLRQLHHHRICRGRRLAPRRARRAAAGRSRTSRHMSRPRRFPATAGTSPTMTAWCSATSAPTRCSSTPTRSSVSSRCPTGSRRSATMSPRAAGW